MKPKTIALPCLKKGYKNYIEAITYFNATIVQSDDILTLSACDGLLLPGGGDIAPELYGQPDEGSRNIDYALDLLQLSITHSFINQKKPILGICKGMQVINICLNGGIIQDLPSSSLSIHAWDGEDRLHNVKAVTPSFLTDFYGKEFTVNSAHHQAIDLPGDGCIPIAAAFDGVIEGIQHTSLPIIGLQWHPERMGFSHRNKKTVNGEYIFSYFFDFF